MIIQTAFLGDLLLGIPFLRRLRELKSGDKITLFCRAGLGALILKTGLVDEVVEYDKSLRSSWLEAKRRLKGRSFDWLFCPHQSWRSLGLALQLKAKHKVGYRGPLRAFVFSHTEVRPMDLPEALRQMVLLTPLESLWPARLEEFRQIQTAPGGQIAQGLVAVPEWATMRLAWLGGIRARFRSMDRSIDRSMDRDHGRLDELTPEAAAIAQRLGFGNKLIMFISPGSTWPTKMWTSDGFAAVARDALAKGYQVVLLGSPAERSICAAIAAAAPGSQSIAGESGLIASAELLALADVLLCNDSGAMHMAALAGVPLVSVFGPTVLEFGYRPWSDRAGVVQVPRVQMTCRPCGKHGAQKCPLGTHACMRDIEPSRVIASLENLRS